MKVIIDIVPNHVARGYQSLRRPHGVDDFGASDDTSVEWARDNNFYYVPGQDFQVPASPDNYRPLGGDEHPLADGKFPESPAKWTGNGSRAAQPRFDDRVGGHDLARIDDPVDGDHDIRIFRCRGGGNPKADDRNQDSGDVKPPFHRFISARWR